jgi:hypothetical protein
LKLIEAAGQMFVEKKDRLKLLAFSLRLDPRAKVMFNGAPDPLALASAMGVFIHVSSPET